jgi:hypothetical protein
VFYIKGCFIGEIKGQCYNRQDKYVPEYPGPPYRPLQSGIGIRFIS